MIRLNSDNFIWDSNNKVGLPDFTNTNIDWNRIIDYTPDLRIRSSITEQFRIFRRISIDKYLSEKYTGIAIEYSAKNLKTGGIYTWASHNLDGWIIILYKQIRS